MPTRTEQRERELLVSLLDKLWADGELLDWIVGMQERAYQEGYLDGRTSWEEERTHGES